MCKLSENNKELKNGKSGRQPHRQGVKVSGHEGQRSGLKGSKSSGLDGLDRWFIYILSIIKHLYALCIWRRFIHNIYIYITRMCASIYIYVYICQYNILYRLYIYIYILCIPCLNWPSTHPKSLHQGTILTINFLESFLEGPRWLQGVLHDIRDDGGQQAKGRWQQEEGEEDELRAARLPHIPHEQESFHNEKKLQTYLKAKYWDIRWYK